MWPVRWADVRGEECVTSLRTSAWEATSSSYLSYHVTHYAFMVTHSTFMDHLLNNYLRRSPHFGNNPLKFFKWPCRLIEFLDLSCLFHCSHESLSSLDTATRPFLAVPKNTGRKRRRERRRKSGRNLANQVVKFIYVYLTRLREWPESQGPAGSRVFRVMFKPNRLHGTSNVASVCFSPAGLDQDSNYQTSSVYWSNCKFPFWKICFVNSMVLCIKFKCDTSN